MDSLVSVIVNCYNGQEYLKEALDSVINQTYKNWELIFFDNFSNDNSKEIFFSYNNSKFKYYTSSSNLKLYDARNQAIKYAKGDYYAFLDVDDIWTKDKLDLQIQTFTDKSVGFSCGNFFLLNMRKNKKTISKVWDNLPSGRVIDNLLEKNFIHMSSLVLKKSAISDFKKVFNSQYTILGDIDLCIRLNIKWNLSSVQKPITYYRYHDNNTGKTSYHLIVEEYKIMYTDLVNNYPEIAENKNFYILKNKIFWTLTIHDLIGNKKIQALKKIRNLSFLNKLKLVFACLLPQKIIKKYFNYRFHQTIN